MLFPRAAQRTGLNLILQQNDNKILRQRYWHILLVRQCLLIEAVGAATLLLLLGDLSLTTRLFSYFWFSVFLTTITRGPNRSFGSGLGNIQQLFDVRGFDFFLTMLQAFVQPMEGPNIFWMLTGTWQVVAIQRSMDYNKQNQNKDCWFPNVSWLRFKFSSF